MWSSDFENDISTITEEIHEINSRLVKVKTNFMESLNGIRPVWKRFEPNMDALKEAMNELQITTDGICERLHDNKSRKRNSDGIRINSNVSDRVFVCVHCKDNSQKSNYCGRTIENVYNHWLESHQNDNNEDVDSVPFLFYVMNRMSCYHCDFSGLYFSIYRHYRDEHRPNNQPFVIVTNLNRQQCALCNGIEGIHFENMTEHFVKEHDYLLKYYFNDPTYWTDDTLNGLRSIDVRQTTQNACYKNNSLDYILCHCNTDMMKIHPQYYFEHCREHTFNVKCAFCRSHLTTIEELVQHGEKRHRNKALTTRLVEEQKRRIKNDFRRIRFVFKNGLVAMAENLLNSTEFANAHVEFEAFVEKCFNDASGARYVAFD